MGNEVEAVFLLIQLVVQLIDFGLRIAADPQQPQRKRPSQSSKRPPANPASKQAAVVVADPNTSASNDVIFHSISKNDTLAGISLLYDVPVASIRTANGLRGDQIQHLRMIIVPLPKVSKKVDDLILPVIEDLPPEPTKESEKVD